MYLNDQNKQNDRSVFFSFRYIENVFPGKYGVPRPWYFFVTKSYWFGSDGNYMPTLDTKATKQNADMEAEPTSFPLGVAIKHIGKTYR